MRISDLLDRALRFICNIIGSFIIISHCSDKVSIQVINITLIIKEELLLFIIILWSIWILNVESFYLNSLQSHCFELGCVIDVNRYVCVHEWWAIVKVILSCWDVVYQYLRLLFLTAFFILLIDIINILVLVLSKILLTLIVFNHLVWIQLIIYF